MNAPSVLAFENVTIAYESGIAVEDVSFEVGKGDFFCVVGANGSGKSSLIRGALGLTPLLRGNVAFAVPREKVSYVPQVETAERNFPATVREIVLTGTQRRGRRIPFYTPSDRKAADAAMRLFEIEDLSGRQIGALSGGQQQRAMLARAMCRAPSLLLLDEPCSGLDTETKRAFYGTLERLNREQNLTIVMVSHDLDDVGTCATRVAELNRTLRFIGDAADWRAFRR